MTASIRVTDPEKTTSESCVKCHSFGKGQFPRKSIDRYVVTENQPVNSTVIVKSRMSQISYVWRRKSLCGDELGVVAPALAVAPVRRRDGWVDSSRMGLPRIHVPPCHVHLRMRIVRSQDACRLLGAG